MRGSLANIPGQTGIHGSRPPDLDLTIRTNPDLDLIPCVGYGSSGSEPTPATAAAELAGKPFPAAALHGNSPELADSCVPWAKSAGVRVGDDQRDLHKPPGSSAGSAGVGVRVRSGRGGAAVADLAGVSVGARSVRFSGHSRVSVHVWLTGKPGLGLRGVLLHSSELATAGRRCAR